MTPDERDAFRLRDARELYLLLGECLAVGSDGIAWRWRLTREIRKLVGADLAYFADNQVLGPPESPGGWLRPLSIIDDWEDESVRPLFWEFVRKGRHERAPLSELAENCKTFEVACRRDYISDEQWYGSKFYRDYLVPTRLDDCIQSVSRTPEGVIQMLFVQRAHGKAPFPRATKDLLAAVWQELRELQPARLSDISDSVFNVLPKRMLQVLACLLAGYTVKETSNVLEVSTHTVQEHVKRLYKRSGTSNRAELAACYRTIAPVLVSIPLDQIPDGELIERATKAPWPNEPGLKSQERAPKDDET